MAGLFGKKINPYYSGPETDHFNGLRFFNPNGIKPSKFREILRWQLSERGTPWPRTFPSPVVPATPGPRAERLPPSLRCRVHCFRP